MSKKEKQIEKAAKYAALITGKINELFDAENGILDLNEVLNDENCTIFFHALANMVPTRFYGRFVDDNITNIDFNHIANKLCFQYSIKKSEE